MPAPQGYVALDLVGFTDKGDYAAGTTYAQNDLVHSDNRIYLSLQDNNVGQALPVSPDTETEFWKLWLSGGGDDLEALTAEDTSNVIGGGAGQVVVAQTLIDAIANKVMNDLVAKSQIINNLLATQAGNVLDATQGKALKDEIDQLNSDIGGAKIYTSPESLGLSASAAPNDFISAMTNNSIFIVDSTVVTSPDWNFPNTFSTLTIVKKQGGRIHIFLYGKQTSNRDYRMFLNQDSTPSGQWEQYITNADLPNVFTGTNLVTLNSPSQLTAPGFYYAEYMSNDVNANSGSNPMSDYSTGDFHMLLLAADANSTSGCRYGTLLVTSPRLTSSLWIGRIWDYQFTYWAKK